MRLSGFDIPQAVLLALAIIAVTLLLGSTRRRLRRTRADAEPSAREQYQALSGATSVTRDVEAVMMELDQLSRQIHGRLDKKIGVLETLIRDADERIDRLSRLHRSAAGRATLDITLDRAHPDAADDLPPTACPNPREAIYRLADGGATAIEIANKLGQSTGEVELILSLRKARGEKAGAVAVRQ